MSEPKQVGEDGLIEVTSGYGASSQMPYVQLLNHKDDWMVQLPAGSARELALNMLAAAEAAETDGSLVQFAIDRMGVAMEQAVGLLVDMREYRESYLGGESKERRHERATDTIQRRDG